MRARHLRTDMGRWMSGDPLGFMGGDWNLYRYVGNGPISFVDPSGISILGTIENRACCAFGLPCCHSRPAQKIDKMKELLQQLSEGQINNLAKFHGYGEECVFWEKVELMVKAFNTLKNEGKEMDCHNYCNALYNLLNPSIYNICLNLPFNSGCNEDMFLLRCCTAYSRSNGLPTLSETLSSWLNWYYGGVWKSLL